MGGYLAVQPQAAQPPATLPADFDGWDAAPRAAAPPKTLPASFTGWDATPAAAAPRQVVAPSVNLTANPKGEGVYRMSGPDGAAVGIPYSNVLPAQRSGYALSEGDRARFASDQAHDPAPSLGAYTPSLMDKVRGTVANSVIGKTLEEASPAAAHALGLTPTETVNSPTYESDREQLFAPQYLLPSPLTGAGRVARGVLTGVGKLTSGKSLAMGAAIAATAGAAAPLLPAVASQGLGLGLLGAGAKGVYGDAKRAADLYAAGDTDGALEAAGEALPNAGLMLPGLAKPIEGLGNAMQDGGVGVMDSYLKAGKKAYRYGAEPGLSVLQEGPGTSLALTRQQLADNISAAKDRVGATIPAVVDASGASIPRSNLQKGVDGVLGAKRAVLTGPGGDTSNLQSLDELRDTFGNLVDAPGSASPAELYAAKRNLDQNINWGRDLDPKSATVNNARREIRSDLSGQLYDAVPELRAPSEQYGSLASASKLATDRTYDAGEGLLSPFRLGRMALTGASAEGFAHNPIAATGIGLATGVLPDLAKAPIVRTGLATGLYQVGRGLAATGRGLARASSLGGGEAAAESPQYAEDGQADSHENESQQQGLPPIGTYSMRNLMPEIIRPGQLSRSELGLGGDGRGGVLVRPLAALPAPATIEPTATPYKFTRQPVQAIPARTPDGLARSIGSTAHVVPSSLLGDVVTPGALEEQAAQLRQAELGSLGAVAPVRSFSSPAGSLPRVGPIAVRGLDGSISWIK